MGLAMDGPFIHVFSLPGARRRVVGLSCLSLDLRIGSTLGAHNAAASHDVCCTALIQCLRFGYLFDRSLELCCEFQAESRWR